MPLALGQPLHFLKHPVQVPIWTTGGALLDGAGGVGARRFDLTGGHVAGFHQVRQHGVGALPRVGRVGVRRVLGGCLEQARHHRRLGERDVAHGLAEIELRRRRHAERAATHVSAIEIHFQDFALGEAAFEQKRDIDFF